MCAGCNEVLYSLRGRGQIFHQSTTHSLRTIFLSAKTLPTMSFQAVIATKTNDAYQFIIQKLKEMGISKKWTSSIIAIGGCISFIISRYVYNKMHFWYYSLPPGPIGIPYIGNFVYTMLYAPNKWHTELSLRHGPVSSFYEFNQLTVIVNDSKISKELLLRANTLDRNLPHEQDQRYEISGRSVAHSDGKQWKMTRRILHSQLVRVMNTKYVNEIMASVISDNLEPELNEIIADQENKENLWFCRKILAEMTFNIIFYANFKQKVQKGDKLATQLAEDLTGVLDWNIQKRRALKLVLPSFLYQFVPESYMEPLFALNKRVNDAIKTMIKRKDEIEKDKGDDVTFMDNVAEMADDDKDLGFEYTKGNQMADVFIMFLAGTDTTSVSLEWGLILLAKQPQIQKQVREELQTVLKKNNIDYKSSSSNILYDIKLLIQLPLFRALIWEILRISCVGRTGVQHSISRADEWITTSDGRKYRLPKGATLLYNVECINYNYLGNESWKNKQNGLSPQEICLDNWLKEESNEFYQNPSFITFGHGKRDCIGKQLALKEMRVILGYFLLNYTFELPAQYSKMREIPSTGGVRFGTAKPKEEIYFVVNKIKY